MEEGKGIPFEMLSEWNGKFCHPLKYFELLFGDSGPLIFISIPPLACTLPFDGVMMSFTCVSGPQVSVYDVICHVYSCI